MIHCWVSADLAGQFVLSNYNQITVKPQFKKNYFKTQLIVAGKNIYLS